MLLEAARSDIAMHATAILHLHARGHSPPGQIVFTYWPGPGASLTIIAKGLRYRPAHTAQARVTLLIVLTESFSARTVHHARQT